MKINGREVGFAFTVAAADEIIQICPDRELAKINQKIGSPDFVENNAANTALIAALSKGYEDARAYADSSYTPTPLTEEELRRLPLGLFYALRSEALEAFNRDIRATVEVEEGKKGERAAAG